MLSPSKKLFINNFAITLFRNFEFFVLSSIPVTTPNHDHDTQLCRKSSTNNEPIAHSTTEGRHTHHARPSVTLFIIIPCTS